MWGMYSSPEIIVDIGPTLHVPSQSVQNYDMIDGDLIDVDFLFHYKLTWKTQCDKHVKNAYCRSMSILLILICV